MNQFITDHFEGIISFILGGVVPCTVWIILTFKKNIVNSIKSDLNHIEYKFNTTFNDLKSKLEILNNRIDNLDDKHGIVKENIEKDLLEISTKLTGLEGLQEAISNIKETMTTQNSLFIKAFESFNKLIDNMVCK